MPTPETKQCPYCEATVGKTEQVCPKCSFDFSQFDDETISNFERISTIVERKREKARKEAEEIAKKKAAEEAAKNPKKRGFFDSLKGRKQ
ncbi:MAG TPA: hypothetical protein VN132_11960 [Bdellovibrio sp.]|nr:hypothetical protein [Bdellovibrio sp.]